MKLKHRALTLLLTIAMLLTFMPAMAFAAPTDHGDPISITFTPADGSEHYSEGRKTTDTIYDEETYEPIGTTGTYIYYDSPEFVEGDKLNVTYEEGSARYTYGKVTDPNDPDSWEYGWISDTAGTPEISAVTEWVAEQDYSHQFTGESKQYKVRLLTENEEGSDIETADTFTSKLVYYGEPKSVSFTHTCGEAYNVEGYLTDEEYNEEEGKYEACTPYIYYEIPALVEGDKISVKYDSNATVEYTYEEDPDDYSCTWVTNDSLAPDLNAGMEWVRKQSSGGIHFAPDTTEEFRVYVSYYAFDEEKEIKVYAEKPLSAFLTYDETQDYDSKYVNNDTATVTYNAGGRKLSVDFTAENESDFCNFPKAGDKVTITEKGKTAKEYTYDATRPYSNYFVSEDGEELSFGWNAEYGALDVWLESKTVDTEKKLNIYTDYYARIDATIITDIESMKYEPSSVSVYSEDIKIVEDGRTYYDFGRRYPYKDEDGNTDYSCYANDDKLIVKFKGTAGTKVYIARNGCFVNVNDPDDELWVSSSGTYLEPGNNSVGVWFHGRSASINVYMDTPALREARAKAARDAAKAAASNINKGTVSAADIKKASDLGATSVTLGASVKKIQKNAFKGTNITTVEVKTKKLKAKSVKGSLKGSKVKTIKVNVGKKKVNKQYVKKYKKIFTKKNAGKKAKVK